LSRVWVGGLGRRRGAARGGEGGVFADELLDALVLFANER